jgi:hypothetical protein
MQFPEACRSRSNKLQILEILQLENYERMRSVGLHQKYDSRLARRDYAD